MYIFVNMKKCLLCIQISVNSYIYLHTYTHTHTHTHYTHTTHLHSHTHALSHTHTHTHTYTHTLTHTHTHACIFACSFVPYACSQTPTCFCLLFLVLQSGFAGMCIHTVEPMWTETRAITLGPHVYTHTRADQRSICTVILVKRDLTIEGAYRV